MELFEFAKTSSSKHVHAVVARLESRPHVQEAIPGIYVKIFHFLCQPHAVFRNLP